MLSDQTQGDYHTSSYVLKVQFKMLGVVYLSNVFGLISRHPVVCREFSARWMSDRKLRTQDGLPVESVQITIELMLPSSQV